MVSKNSQVAKGDSSYTVASIIMTLREMAMSKPVEKAEHQ